MIDFLYEFNLEILNSIFWQKQLCLHVMTRNKLYVEKNREFFFKNFEFITNYFGRKLNLVEDFSDELSPSCFSDSIFDSGFSYNDPDRDWKGTCSSGSLQSPIDIPRTGLPRCWCNWVKLLLLFFLNRNSTNNFRMLKCASMM